MIEVNNLVKKYGEFDVLQSIDFKVEKGLVFGFLGKNGAGKSTTMNILTGLIGFNSGQIKFEGLDFTKNKGKIMQSIGYLTENPIFYEYMTAVEYLSFIAELSNYAGSRKKRIDELLEQVKLTEAKGRKVGGYSRGMKQRLGLAVALFNHPKYLFLDEPTSALDPQGRLEMVDLISQLKGNEITVFLSTHILSDVERVCDEVSILDKGKILVTENLKKLQQEYIQPIFDISFEEECGEVAKSLEELSWVENVKLDNRKISVYAQDMNLAKERLMGELIKHKNPVLNYQVRQGNLEDIFIRMVNNNGII